MLEIIELTGGCLEVGTFALDRDKPGCWVIIVIFIIAAIIGAATHDTSPPPLPKPPITKRIKESVKETPRIWWNRWKIKRAERKWKKEQEESDK